MEFGPKIPNNDVSSFNLDANRKEFYSDVKEENPKHMSELLYMPVMISVLLTLTMLEILFPTGDRQV